MSWNYRVVREIDAANQECFAIHEVYYDAKRGIKNWTGPIEPFGESLAELRSTLSMMGGALDRPVLELRDGKLAAPDGTSAA